jgi:hypothetical protein
MKLGLLSASLAAFVAFGVVATEGLAADSSAEADRPATGASDKAHAAGTSSDAAQPGSDRGQPPARRAIPRHHAPTFM